MSKKLTAILIGAGNRGIAYTDIMSQMADKYEIIAVAEPVDSRRNYIKNKHALSDEMCFTDYQDLLALGKIADMAIITTMDQLHFDPAMKAIALKYDLLLEKPVCPQPEECLKIALFAEEMGVKALVCHVLRYSDMFLELKRMIHEGLIGDIVSINHEECVGNVHQSHSFVRGNWGNSTRSSCMLLQKSCHDLDILQWLIGKKCKKIQSFGSLTYFKQKNAPEGSPEYCIEGCPKSETCPYNAVKIYLDDKTNDWFRTTCTKNAAPTDEDVIVALTTSQYGKCVYKCDNDVVDHQTVNMLFEDDVTVTFTMNAFNKGGRFIHIMGTKGEIRAAIDGTTPITVFDFETRQITEHSLTSKDGITGGHGGGDYGIISTLYDYLTGTYEGFSVSELRTSVENHLLVFAAEKSRATNTVVDLDEYIDSLV